MLICNFVVKSFISTLGLEVDLKGDQNVALQYRRPATKPSLAHIQMPYKLKNQHETEVTSHITLIISRVKQDIC